MEKKLNAAECTRIISNDYSKWAMKTITRQKYIYLKLNILYLKGTVYYPLFLGKRESCK